MEYRTLCTENVVLHVETVDFDRKSVRAFERECWERLDQLGNPSILLRIVDDLEPCLLLYVSSPLCDRVRALQILKPLEECGWVGFGCADRASFTVKEGGELVDVYEAIEVIESSIEKLLSYGVKYKAPNAPRFTTHFPFPRRISSEMRPN